MLASSSEQDPVVHNRVLSSEISEACVIAIVKAIVAADRHPDHIRMTAQRGITALMTAAEAGKPRIVEILIKADPSEEHINMKVG
jgi:hypothetical protein